MKKIISAIILICCIFSLSSCFLFGDESDGDAVNGVGLFEDELNGVVKGEKYYSVDKLESQNYRYYVFDGDHIEYTYYYYSDANYVVHYTIIYKYVVIEKGMIAIFSDSVEIYDDDNASSEDKLAYYNGQLILSKNVLINLVGNNFVRESYLENELKNFGKEKDQ